MKELFLKHSVLNGSLTGNRFVNAAEAPQGPEQQAELPKEKAKKLPQSPEQAVRETKVEGRKAIRKAKVIDMPAMEIKPRTEKERAHDEAITAKVKKTESFKAMNEAVAEVTRLADVLEDLKNLPPQLERQARTLLKSVDAASMPEDQFSALEDKIHDIVSAYMDNEDARATSRALLALNPNREALARAVRGKGLLGQEGAIADLLTPTQEGGADASSAVASRRTRK